MASLIDTLTASGGTESAGFLNDIVAQLWPNISVAASQIAKDVVEPMFASMLPGPLATLHFVKLDLGQVPIRFSKVDVHRTETQGIKLDMDLDWQGKCDIELDGNMVPKIGIESVQLKGRLSILLCPLTNIIPLIGAAQVAFINPPSIKLDFTNAANIADCSLIEKAVRTTILGVISSMAVLPNRFLVKLDGKNDYFKTYQPHLGVLRLTVGKATGIKAPEKKQNGAQRLLGKLIKDVPDCYCKVILGAEEVWRTSTKKNDKDPEWNETHDFLVSDHEQSIEIDVQDDDLAGDDDMGIGMITIKQLLLAGGKQELRLAHNGEPTGAGLSIHAQFYSLVDDASTVSAEAHQDSSPGQILGVATVLIASVQGLTGQRDELNPSVKVAWGPKTEFRTGAQTYSPGTDIFNPNFDTAFKIPLTAELLANPSEAIKLTLLNKKDESGSAEVSFSDVLGAPGMVLEDSFDVGSGAVIRARISVRGLQLAQ